MLKKELFFNFPSNSVIKSTLIRINYVKLSVLIIILLASCSEARNVKYVHVYCRRQQWLERYPHMPPLYMFVYTSFIFVIINRDLCMLLLHRMS